MKSLTVWFLTSCALVGLGRSQTVPTEASLREKLVALRVVTPTPTLPPPSENPGDRQAYYEKTKPLWTAYWEKEHPRLLALAGIGEELLAHYPKTEDAPALENEMAEAYIQVVASGGPGHQQARDHVAELLKRTDLRVETYEAFYRFQINTIAIQGWGTTLDEIAAVPRDGREIQERIRQAIDKFAARFPGSPALGRLSFFAASFLAPGRSFATGDTAKLQAQWLKQAEDLGDEMTRHEVALVRFRADAPGKAAPEVAFTALDGSKVDLAKLKGKVVVLDFWATWCGPCVEALPKLQALEERHREQGLAVIGISLDSERAKLEAFLSRHPMPWPQSFDGGGWKNVIAERFGVRSIPEAWLIDRTGRVVAIDPANLDKAVEAELAR